MKRFFITFFAAVLVVLGALLIYINMRASDLIASFLSKQLKTEVGIDGASIGFSTIEILGLSISNPEASTLQNALSAESVTIDFKLSTLFKNTIVIPLIHIQNPTIGVEFYNLKGSENNWSSILANLSPQEKSDKKVSESREEKKVIIDTLTLSNLKIEAMHKMLGPYAVTINAKEHLEFHHLTKEKAIRIKSSLDLIFKSILTTISKLKGFKQVLNTPPDEFLDNIDSQLPKDIMQLQPTQDDDWDKLTRDIEGAPKKAKEFFNKLFKSW